MKSDSKRRAIIISFQFPPRGNTASQRSNAWSMYLAEFGYHPVIITKNYDESEKRLLTHSSHPASDIYRIRAKEIMQVHSQNLAKDDKRIRAKAYSLLRTVFHFSYIFGPYRVFRDSAVEIIRNTPDPKILVVTAMPFGGFRVAHDLHRKTGIKWIGDYRDDWTTTEIPNPNRIRRFMLRYIEPYLEKKWLSSAAGFTTVSSHYVKKISALLDYKIPGACVENGYFQEENLSSKGINKFDELSFVYVGSMYQLQDIRPILRTLNETIEDLKFRFLVRVYFMGTVLADNQKREFEKICSSEKLELVFTSRLPKEEALELQNRCHVGLIVPHTGLKGVPSSKLYEFIGGRMPVLFYPSDKDVIHNTLMNCGLGIFSKDVKEMKKNLAELLAEFEANGSISRTEIREEEIEFYSRRRSTGRLAQFLDKTLSYN